MVCSQSSETYGKSAEIRIKYIRLKDTNENDNMFFLAWLLIVIIEECTYRVNNKVKLNSYE